MNIYRIEKGNLKEIKKLVFTAGDSYLVDDDKTIWVWHGKDASIDEKASAAAHSKKLDDSRAGVAKIITLEQDEFSANSRRFKAFCSEHGGLKIVDKNVAESMLTHYEKAKEEPPVLFKVSSEEFDGDINAIDYVQVKRKRKNLDPDDVMLLWVPEIETTFLWVGSGANVKEKVVAGQIARRFDRDRVGVQKEVFIEEGEETEEFLKYLD